MHTTELANTLGVKIRNVQRYAQKYKKEGGREFFQPKTRKGQAHKLTPDKIDKANELLQEGKSNYYVAKKIGVLEGTIRYQIKQGKLKNSPSKKNSK